MNIEWDSRLPYVEALTKSLLQREEDKLLEERMLRITMNNNQRTGTVFDRATNEPCLVCMDMVAHGHLRREAVMPLPKFGPVGMGGNKICFDCQSAENLVKYGILFDFESARTAVANERQETLRLPLGIAESMGMCMEGLIKPASEEDFENHQSWLNAIYPVDENDFNYG